MKTVYVNEKNLETIRGKEIYIYGAGTLGENIKKWLNKNGIFNVRYCVDDVYKKNNEKILYWSECKDKIISEEALLILGIGDSRILDSVERKKIKTIYMVFNPYEFWKYNDVSVYKLQELFEKYKEKYKDEISQKTLIDYIEAIRLNDGSVEKNVIADTPYFNDELTPKIKDGTYVDVGAFTGDTVEAFIEFYGDNRNIIGLEPDELNFEIFKEKYEGNSNVTCIQKGAFSKNGKIGFSNGKGQRSEINLNRNDNYIEVVKIDEICKNEKVSYIKIGNDFALEILKGSIETLKKDQPIIVMNVSYCLEILIDIPRFFEKINKFGIKYKLYLRHYSLSSGLLFIYAIPEDM